MRKLLTCLPMIFALLLSAPALPAAAEPSLKEVLDQLDATLQHRDTYITNRELRIGSLKNILRQTNFSDAQQYALNQQLIDEYTPYQVDSTIDYLYDNIALAERMHSAQRLNDSRIQLAYLYSAAGIYLEAANTLAQVDSTRLTREQLVNYYVARHKLNDELQLYSHDVRQQRLSRRLTDFYARLIVENTDPETPTHLNYRLREEINRRNFPDAVALADRLCEMQPPLSRDYAEAAYMRALVADLMDDTPTAQIWFARSAMADIQLAIRDNAALKSLANTLLDDDNIQRAMHYMRIVMDDARFFNSRLRPWQDALTLHVIEEAYQARRQRMDRMYNIFLVSTVVFMLLAVGGVIFMRRQNRKLSLARLELQQANNRLNISNNDLMLSNRRLADLNSQISEANEVKEEYIGIFLTMCSEYIDKIIAARRHVRHMLRDGRIDELRKEFATTEADHRELEEFYRNFDTTFLQLYPTFIEDFNSLLDKEARIELKKGELLTTELRIFALIRLGINDSSKIAALLRYSVSTIYNYRSKIKSHTTVSRDTFEERIKTIGDFSSQHN